MPLTYRFCYADFEPVADLFASFDDGQYEAQLAVYLRGELIIDLAAGISPDAMMTVYSSSKGLAAFALAVLVDRDQLDLDATVAGYWPEFAAAGKQDVTVRQLLSHQTGLPAVDGGMPPDAWLDDHESARRLAEQRPFWRPGSAFGYHAISIGSLISELCFRITGQTLQQFYEAEVRTPSRADAYLGLPEELEDRVVELLPMAEPTPAQRAEFAAELSAPQGPYRDAVFTLGSNPLTGSEARRFGHPAGGGVASARGLAGVYRWAIEGGVDQGTLAAFAQAQVIGYDVVLDLPHRSHGIVFQKPTPILRFGSHQAFGHDGAGGAMALADPQTGLALGYTIRRVPFPGGCDRRVITIIDSIRTILSL